MRLTLWPITASLLCCLSARAQHCDAQLASAVPPNDPNRYREREDRCEGLYYRRVSGETLLITSFTEIYEDFSPESSKSLLLEWSTPTSGATRLRGYSLRPRLLYRMDTSRPGGVTAYTWRLGVVSALQIGKRDLGIVAWTDYRVGGHVRNLYLPLRVREGAETAAVRRLRLIVTPGLDATEIFLTVGVLGPDGTPASFAIRDRPLQYGSYPAGRPVSIDLPELKKPGIYLAKVGARFVNTASTSQDVFFYHSGP